VGCREASDVTDVPHAVERRSRWAGWIWAVPIAALAIVTYLMVKEFALRGPSVTVTFATAGGLKPSDTKVQYQGLQIGEVDSVMLHNDLKHVDVVLRLHSHMAGHLGPGTRFWIGGEHPRLNNLASIKSVITGPYIGVDPHDGPQQNHYVGLAEPPVVQETVAGTHYTLNAESVGTVSRGSLIDYRNFDVGKVESVTMPPDGSHFVISAFVRAPYDKLVHADSHFWNAGAVQVAMTGPGPRLQFQSVPALFSGAIAFETPDATATQAPGGTKYTLYDSKSEAENAPNAHSVRYRVVFRAADAGGLTSGAPVQLARQEVGSVEATTLQFNPASQQLESIVTIALDPSHIQLAGNQAWEGDPRPQMDGLLRDLIAQGLRARLGKSVPIVGGDAVLLDFVSNATQASLGAGNPPQIPTAPGSDIEDIIASASGFSAKLQAMPLDQIAGEIHETAQKLAALSNSPQLKASLLHLDQTLSNVDQVSHEAREQIGPILVKLRRVSEQAQATLAAARSLVASNGAVQNQPQTTGLGNALYELSRTARSLRELSDFLDEHPEALLRGRGHSG
jgi:paraquat-inducible protein B